MNNEKIENNNFKINDLLLNHSKIAAYNINCLFNSKKQLIPYNPKKFPNNAIYIIFYISNKYKCELFFKTKTKKWISKIWYDNLVSQFTENQFDQFFKTNFYLQLLLKLKNTWPLKNNLHFNLFKNLENKKYYICNQKNKILEADKEIKRWRNPNPKLPTHSPSGRKYVRFSDIGVSSKDFEFFCWPKKGKEFHWSSWKNWKTQRPFVCLKFKFNNVHYGVTLPLFNENFKYRGFRAYDNDWEPPLAWLSKEEFLTIPKLSIFNKFIKYCIKRIRYFISIDTEELMKKINRPDKITENEINNTKLIIKKVLKNTIIPKKFDQFKWRN